MVVATHIVQSTLAFQSDVVCEGVNSEVPLFTCDIIREAYLDTRVAATPAIANTAENVPCGGGGEQLLALALWDSLKLAEGTVIGSQEHV